MICPHCGTQLPDEARFCAECGAQLDVQAQAPDAVAQVPAQVPATIPVPVPAPAPVPDPAPAPFSAAPVSAAPVSAEYYRQNGLPVPPDGYYDEMGVPYPTTGATAMPAPAQPTDWASATPPVPQGYAEGSVAQSTQQSAPHTDKGKGHRRGLGIAIGAGVTLLLLACIGMGMLFATLVARGGFGAATCAVTFSVQIDGFDKNSSRVPVRITGTDDDGNEIDTTIFLAHEGVDTELAEGDYTAQVLCTPIASDGTLYEVKNDLVHLHPSAKETTEDYGYLVEDPFVFYPLDDASMTRELADEALSWARKDEESGVDVGLLEDALNRRLSAAAADDAAKDDAAAENTGDGAADNTAEQPAPEGDAAAEQPAPAEPAPAEPAPEQPAPEGEQPAEQPAPEQPTPEAEAPAEEPAPEWEAPAEQPAA